jgi:putative membrane protein
MYFLVPQKSTIQKIAMEISNLPAINAVFNFFSTICLLSGYYFIKKSPRDEVKHKFCMILALIFSAIFLTGYVTYHYHHGSTKFPDLGWIKTLYLVILIPHIILAAVMVPMIIMTFIYAFRGNFEKHKKIARFTFPIWMYVSVTGVIIYLMLYQLFRV